MSSSQKSSKNNTCKELMKNRWPAISFIYDCLYQMFIIFSFSKEFDGTLDSISAALTCAFNRTGSLLAVGCNDGRLVVWDFLTRGIAKVYSAHVHPVCSVRYVL